MSAEDDAEIARLLDELDDVKETLANTQRLVSDTVAFISSRYPHLTKHLEMWMKTRKMELKL